MFRQLSYWQLSIVIVSIFTSTNVSALTCGRLEKTCFIGRFDSWCCQSSESCGYSNGKCFRDTTTSPTPPLSDSDSDSSSGSFYYIFIFFPVFLCCICMRWYIRSERTTQQPRLRPSRMNRNPRGPTRVARIQPVCNINTALPTYNIYEEPPPSYDVATSNISHKDPSASPPPLTTTVETTPLLV